MTGTQEEILGKNSTSAESINENTDFGWLGKSCVKICIRLCALVVLSTICFNIPQPLEDLPQVVLALNLIATLLLTIETISKMLPQGFLWGKNAFLRDHWGRLEAITLLFLWFAIIIQILEMSGVVPILQTYYNVRSPRPFLMIRFLKLLFDYSLPKARIDEIYRPLLYTLTFYGFYMLLFCLLQWNGDTKNYCVHKSDNFRKFLQPPGARCSLDNPWIHPCYIGMKCLNMISFTYLNGGRQFVYYISKVLAVCGGSPTKYVLKCICTSVPWLPDTRAAVYSLAMVFSLGSLLKTSATVLIDESIKDLREECRRLYANEREEEDEADENAMLLNGSDGEHEQESASPLVTDHSTDEQSSRPVG